jgi:hypothetical protein
MPLTSHPDNAPYHLQAAADCIREAAKHLDAAAKAMGPDATHLEAIAGQGFIHSKTARAIELLAGDIGDLDLRAPGREMV